MSKRRSRDERRSKRQAENVVSHTSLSAGAAKTYLQEQVALLRPQVSETEIAHLFRFGVTAYAASNYRATALRQVDFALGDAQGNLLADLPPQGKAIQAALRHGMPGLMERTELSHCYYGEILWLRLYDNRDRLSGFHWINNNFFMADTDHWEGLKGFRVRSVWATDLDPDVTYIPVEESVYMHNVDFFEDFGGVGPVQVAYAQAATETEISATQLQFFRNMAMPAFAMQPAQGGYVPGPDQKTELTELMRRMYQGAANAGRALILPTRWELLKFQQDFDKLGMPELSDRSRDALIRILGVPLELLESHQSKRTSGAKFYEQKREWLISWLVPQAERYADVLTEQVAQPINPEWRVMPIFTRVRGLDEDISSRTDTVQKQITMGVLDLLTGQQILGVVPDQNLKGMYMIGGVPVPTEEIRDYWRFAPGNPGMVLGGETNAPDKPSRKPTDDEKKVPKEAPEPGKTIPFLPDAVYRELKNWKILVERKGIDYAFEGKSLAADTVAYGRFLLSTSKSVTPEIWQAIHIYAAKDYDATERLYRTDLYNLMQDAFNGRLDRKQFGIAGRDSVSTAFLNAFSNGLREGGVDPAEMDDEERERLKDETKAERAYWTSLSNEMYREVMPLRDTETFSDARNKMLARIELWINKGLYRLYELGTMYARMNGMKRWVYGGTINHCETCKTAEGQVHRAREWLRAGVYPRSDSCICTGIKCQCSLEDTTDAASGSLASIPLAAAKSMEDDEPMFANDDDESIEAVV